MPRISLRLVTAGGVCAVISKNLIVWVYPVKYDIFVSMCWRVKSDDIFLDQ